MSAPEIRFNSLPDRAALGFLQNKKLLPGFSHYDVWMQEHAVAFTVAKMMDADMLADVRQMLADAIEQGTTFNDFKKQLKPYLMDKGWWGEQIMTDPEDDTAKLVQLGSTRRLRTIFHTNLATAHAAGQWARIQQNKRALPYLKYIPSYANSPRDGHKRYYNLILPVEHELWAQIMPPNGYGCLCGVRQLTRRQAMRERGEDIARYPDRFTDEQKADHEAGILNDKPDVPYIDFTNPRTGEVVRVPADITPTFAHNHGDRVAALDKMMADKHGKISADELQAMRAEYLRGKMPSRIDPKIFESPSSIIDEGRRIFEKHKDLLIDARERGTPAEAILEIMKKEGVEFGGEPIIKGYKKDIIKEVQAAIESVYPKDWIDKSNEAGAVWVGGDNKRAFHLMPDLSHPVIYERFAKNRRAGYRAFQRAFAEGEFKNGDSMLLVNTSKKLSKEWSISTHIHEYGHRLQKVMPELNEHFVALWRERTAKDDIERLADLLPGVVYDITEITKKDDFPHPYYGKVYGKSLDDPRPDEMLAMTFEALLGNKLVRFDQLANKPDFLYFGLAILTRFKP